MIHYQNKATIDFFGPVDIENIDLEGFAKELNKVQGQELEILINSPGGDIFDGVAIADLIQRREAHTTTTAIGLAASIATVVLMAGDTVQMSESATIMIHDAWTFEAGDSETLKKTADTLDKMSEIIANIYTNQIEKAGKILKDRDTTKKMIRKLMKNETWLDANEALNIGLIDKIVKPVKDIEFTFGAEGMSDNGERMSFQNSLSNYKNVPTKIFNKYNSNSNKMQDKTSIWSALKSFFVSEIKEEAQAIEAQAQQTKTDKKMTIEEMKKELLKQGFEVQEKADFVEPVFEETTETETTEAENVTADSSEVDEMREQLKAILKEQTTLKAELKAAKFKAVSKPSDSVKEDTKNNGTIKVGEANKNAFAALAQIIKTK
jgi:ATP-dependent protease ClpP protease subunit